MPAWHVSWVIKPNPLPRMPVLMMNAISKRYKEKTVQRMTLIERRLRKVKCFERAPALILSVVREHHILAIGRFDEVKQSTKIFNSHSNNATTSRQSRSTAVLTARPETLWSMPKLWAAMSKAVVGTWSVAVVTLGIASSRDESIFLCEWKLVLKRRMRQLCYWQCNWIRQWSSKTSWTVGYFIWRMWDAVSEEIEI